MDHFKIESASVVLVIVKAKEANAHKKPAKPSRVEIKANSKTVTLWLSAKHSGPAFAPVTYKITVETDNLLIARIEARKAVRGFGFKDNEIIELDHITGRGNPE